MQPRPRIKMDFDIIDLIVFTCKDLCICLRRRGDNLKKINDDSL